MRPFCAGTLAAGAAAGLILSGCETMTSADLQAITSALTAGAATQGTRSDKMTAMSNSLNASTAAQPATPPASQPASQQSPQPATRSAQAPAAAPAPAVIGGPSPLRVEFSGSMARCLKVVRPTSDPSVNSSNTTAEYREKMSRGAVVINTCPEHLAILYCDFDGGTDAINGNTVSRGCSAGVVGGTEYGPSNGKVVRDRSKPSWDRYIWTDRTAFYTPRAIHACNARTEMARMQGGNYKVPKLAGSATCAPRTGNPFSSVYKGLVVINE